MVERAELRARAHRRGSSLVELLLALALTAVVLGGVALAASRAQDLMSANESALRLDQRQSRAAVQVTKVLLGAGTGTLTPDLVPPGPGPTPWADEIRLRSAAGFQAGGIQWSEVQVLRFERDAGELDNGLDDDGDGLVDEGSLVWIVDEGGLEERRVVLASGVAELLEGEEFNGVDDNGNGLVDEAGACFAVDEDGLVSLRFTLEDAPRGALVRRTRLVRVALRNTLL